MKKNIFSSTLSYIFITSSFLLIAFALNHIISPVFAQAVGNPDKVDICHATNSHSNPYVLNNVDSSAIDGAGGNSDHYHHTGPIWFSGITEDWGDIIPPLAGVHNGLNWTDEGRRILESGCNIPSSTPTPTVTPTPTPTPTPKPTATPTSSPTPTPCPEAYTCEQCLDFEMEDTQCNFEMYQYCQKNYDCGYWGIRETWTCACPSPTPTPTMTPTPTPTPTMTPEPTPTSTPDPKSGKHSSLGIHDPDCENNEIEATYTAKEDGEARKDVEVTFTYLNDERIIKTDENGKAKTIFTYNGEGTVYTKTNDGYPEQSDYIDPLDCPVEEGGTGGGFILGASTEAEGQVLGASTDVLAETGIFSDNLYLALRALLGFVIGFFFMKKYAKITTK